MNKHSPFREVFFNVFQLSAIIVSIHLHIFGQVQSQVPIFCSYKWDIHLNSMYCLCLLVFRNNWFLFYLYVYMLINIYVDLVACYLLNSHYNLSVNSLQTVSSAVPSVSDSYSSPPSAPNPLFLVLLFWLGSPYNIEVLKVEFLSGDTPPFFFLKEMLLYLYCQIFTLRFLIKPYVSIRKISSCFPRAFKLNRY